MDCEAATVDALVSGPFRSAWNAQTACRRKKSLPAISAGRNNHAPGSGGI